MGSVDKKFEKEIAFIKEMQCGILLNDYDLGDMLWFMKHFNEQEKDKKGIIPDPVTIFSEEDLKLAYQIGFGHAKEFAGYQGDEIVETLKRADDFNKNISFE